jgi:hypothetical protein
MTAFLLFLILLALLFPSLLRAIALLLGVLFLCAIISMGAHAEGWRGGDRGEWHDHDGDRGDDGWRGWRGWDGWPRGDHDDPNWKGTVYCWANRVWIWP